MIQQNDRTIPLGFWLLGVVLVIYVALCTGYRDNHWSTDAWEHHRVLKTLTEQLWNPGNPTYATDAPSARYSPYAIGWASLSRITGLDPYQTLSLAAIVNTILLITGVAALLKSFGEAPSALAGLIVMLGLYGGAPGHSNSYALSDLPWHQVNPSAFSFAITLFVWALFGRFGRKGWRDFSLPLMVVLCAIALLDHPLTGVLTQFGICLFAIAAKPPNRRRLIGGVFCLWVGVALLCSLWPWFSFIQAATTKLPFSINLGVSHKMLTQWCVPAVACGLFAFTYRERKMVRLFLLGGYVIYFAGLLVFILPPSMPGTSLLYRIPLSGLIFFHLALGVFIYRTGLLELRTWPRRLKTLVAGGRPQVPQAAIEVTMAIVLGYFLLPQFYTVLEEPHLARAYIAPLLGKENKQIDLKSRFDALLEPVGRRDVVLSDPQTMWPIPSSRGRIVYAIHPELFVPDRGEKYLDVETFFSIETSDTQRIELLEKHSVRWLVLNRNQLDESVFATLLVESAIVRRDNDFILMDAVTWREAKLPDDRK
ncbi:hypothetical protein IQ235_00495 [Oscillatoriales cyanobacterium LEGE 11467]|uniref:Uncharacterized protein n=1 Tax=Zarconia navalis LEGE 11467 TaxID=1828826 RepID=A0A928VRY3_9CYAN|nr:hypothetical protein [Zarconia navalis]MBE9039274.1 hypothetical protein [Zarconia navalis LEGE 11467]